MLSGLPGIIRELAAGAGIPLSEVWMSLDVSVFGWFDVDEHRLPVTAQMINGALRHVPIRYKLNKINLKL